MSGVGNFSYTVSLSAIRINLQRIETLIFSTGPIRTYKEIGCGLGGVCNLIKTINGANVHVYA